jgi:HTH-type transcriptional regulator, competence development regulator
MTLGRTLRNARVAKGMSLRDVERATKGKVSNGYLSLLESGDVKQPSPHHLHHLAKAFELEYAQLMRLAGYVVPESPMRSPDTHTGRGTPSEASVEGLAFSADDLTESERRQVEEYIALLRRARSSSNSR